MKKITLLLVCLLSNVPAHAAWTTITAATVSQWTATSLAVPSAVGTIQMTCENQTDNANIDFQATLTVESQTVTYPCDNNTYTMTNNKVGTKQLNIIGISKAPTKGEIKITVNLTTLLYPPTTTTNINVSTATTGKVCQISINNNIAQTVEPGSTTEVQITQETTASESTPSITITPDATDGTGGVLRSENNHTIGYGVAGLALTDGGYSTTSANNTIAITAPADAASGNYSGSATVALSCQ